MNRFYEPQPSPNYGQFSNGVGVIYPNNANSYEIQQSVNDDFQNHANIVDNDLPFFNNANSAININYGVQNFFYNQTIVPPPTGVAQVITPCFPSPSKAVAFVGPTVGRTKILDARPESLWELTTLGTEKQTCLKINASDTRCNSEFQRFQYQHSPQRPLPITASPNYNRNPLIDAVSATLGQCSSSADGQYEYYGTKHVVKHSTNESSHCQQQNQGFASYQSNLSHQQLNQPDQQITSDWRQQLNYGATTTKVEVVKPKACNGQRLQLPVAGQQNGEESVWQQPSAAFGQVAPQSFMNGTHLNHQNVPCTPKQFIVGFDDMRQQQQPAYVDPLALIPNLSPMPMRLVNINNSHSVTPKALADNVQSPTIRTVKVSPNDDDGNGPHQNWNQMQQFLPQNEAYHDYANSATMLNNSTFYPVKGQRQQTNAVYTNILNETSHQSNCESFVNNSSTTSNKVPQCQLGDILKMKKKKMPRTDGAVPRRGRPPKHLKAELQQQVKVEQPLRSSSFDQETNGGLTGAKQFVNEFIRQLDEPVGNQTVCEEAVQLEVEIQTTPVKAELAKLPTIALANGEKLAKKSVRVKKELATVMKEIVLPPKKSLVKMPEVNRNDPLGLTEAAFLTLLAKNSYSMTKMKHNEKFYLKSLPSFFGCSLKQSESGAKLNSLSKHLLFDRQLSNPSDESSVPNSRRLPLWDGRFENDKQLKHRLTKNLFQPPCKCSCVTGEINEAYEGPYYTHLGAAPNIDEMRKIIEGRLGESGEAVRIEKVIFTGKEGKTNDGCPIAKWIIRRRGPSEKILCVVRERVGHHCATAVLCVVLVVWDGVPKEQADDLYSFLTQTLPVYGMPTERKCELNEKRNCACQGTNEQTAGASFSFGCSWSMYYNACKFAKSPFPRKFKLVKNSRAASFEPELEEKCHLLADSVGPVYKQIAPIAYRNQTWFSEIGQDCRIGHNAGGPFSGITACADFCAHAHTDTHNMNNGCTVVVTLTKHRGFDKPDDEQLHVLPLYVMDSKNNNEQNDPGIEILTKYPLNLRLRTNRLPSCKQRSKMKKNAAGLKKKNAKASPPLKKPKLGRKSKSPNKTPSINGMGFADSNTNYALNNGASFNLPYGLNVDYPQQQYYEHQQGVSNQQQQQYQQFDSQSVYSGYANNGSLNNYANYQAYGQQGQNQTSFPNGYYNPQQPQMIAMHVANGQHHQQYQYPNFSQEIVLDSNGQSQMFNSRPTEVNKLLHEGDATESNEFFNQFTENASAFEDPTVGGVAIALSHGSILFEVAKKELHATTALRYPDRRDPKRISLVFYQHKRLNHPKHGFHYYAKKRREKELLEAVNGKVKKRAPTKGNAKGRASVDSTASAASTSETNSTDERDSPEEPTLDLPEIDLLPLSEDWHIPCKRWTSILRWPPVDVNATDSCRCLVSGQYSLKK